MASSYRHLAHCDRYTALSYSPQQSDLFAMWWKTPLNNTLSHPEYIKCLDTLQVARHFEQFTEHSDLQVSDKQLPLSEDPTFLNSLSDLAAGLSRSPLSDISARLHLLQDACNHGWLLPTSEIAQVLAISPKTLTHHKSYQHYGFTFNKIGCRGVESAWEVTKS